MFVSPYFTRIQQSRPATPAPSKLAPDQPKARRAAIGYMYIYALFRPHPDTWVEVYVVTAIMQTLNIPLGSFGRVKQCLLYKANTNSGKRFEPSKNHSERNRAYKIQQGTEEAHIIFMCFIRLCLFQAIDKFSANVDPRAAH